MVLIGGIKYACERCIRGHRVTTCNHTDQPLMMIKPKGRPSSQCKHCKEMRKNKNSHSSGACTCGRKQKGTSGSSITKHCGCDAGKPCMCHGKRKAGDSKVSLDKPPYDASSSDKAEGKVRQIGMDPLAAAKPASDTTRTRVGEVSVPLNEYIPSKMNGVGSVNDKIPEGFFQDVPLPFEPGHGLLDLFSEKHKTEQEHQHKKRDSSSSLSPGSGHTNQVQSPIEGIADFFPYFPMATSNSTSTSAASILSSTDSVASLLPHSAASNTNSSSSNNNITPTNNYHLYDNMIHKPLLGKRPSAQSYPKDTLFGTFESDMQQNSHNHNTSRPDDTQSTRSARSVEVLSLTPTFKDIPSSYYAEHSGITRQTSTSQSLQSGLSKAPNDEKQTRDKDDIFTMVPPAYEPEVPIDTSLDPFAFSTSDAVLNLPNELHGSL